MYKQKMSGDISVSSCLPRHRPPTPPDRKSLMTRVKTPIFYCCVRLFHSFCMELLKKYRHSACIFLKGGLRAVSKCRKKQNIQENTHYFRQHFRAFPEERGLFCSVPGFWLSSLPVKTFCLDGVCQGVKSAVSRHICL